MRAPGRSPTPIFRHRHSRIVEFHGQVSAQIHEEFSPHRPVYQLYKSCANRHCPKCQGGARAKWLEARAADLLETRYFHVVFTLPDKLGPIALQNKRLVYGLLFRAASETLLKIAKDPKHLGADIGFLAVLHTWGQRLDAHPQVNRFPQLVRLGLSTGAASRKTPRGVSGWGIGVEGRIGTN